MNDTDFNTQRSRIEKLIEHWSPIVGLDNWEVQNLYFYAPNEHNQFDDKALATTAASWTYRRVTFNWYLQVVETVEDDPVLERHVIHELCHTLIDPLHIPSDSFDADRLEYVTQCVADSLLRLRDYVNIKEAK